MAWLHLGQVWGLGGAIANRAVPACTLSGGAARPWPVGARSCCQPCPSLHSGSGQGILIPVPPPSFPTVTSSSSGCITPARAKPPALFQSPAQPQGNKLSLCCREKSAPDWARQEGSPGTMTQQPCPEPLTTER